VGVGVRATVSETAVVELCSVGFGEVGLETVRCGDDGDLGLLACVCEGQCWDIECIPGRATWGGDRRTEGGRKAVGPFRSGRGFKLAEDTEAIQVVARRKRRYVFSTVD
jgi:hypothetical protein